MKTEERTVGTDFRNFIFNRYPALKVGKNNENAGFASLFCHGTLGARSFKNEDGNVLLWSKWCAEWEGKENLFDNRDYSAKDFLLRFTKATGIQIVTTDYSSFAGKCRELISFKVDDDIQEMINKELTGHYDKSPRVYFVSGCAYSPKRQKQFREMNKLEALERSAGTSNPDALMILDYLNNIAPNRHTEAIKAHLDEAVQVAFNLDTPKSAMDNLKLLRMVRDQPLPFYAPSKAGKTVRVFGIGPTILSTKSEVRKVITQDWWEADLKSAQLAIVAKEWNIPFVQGLLEEEVGVWDYFTIALGIECDGKVKEAIKDALYATIFGMKSGDVSGMLYGDLKVRGIGKKFITTPLMAELFKARDRMMIQVEKDKGMTNCYGERISIEGTDAASVLSQCAQATEMYLLAPIFELAKDNQEIAITLFQHDGFCFTTRQLSRGKYWAERFTQVVADRVRGGGYATSLKVVSPHPFPSSAVTSN